MARVALSHFVTSTPSPAKPISTTIPSAVTTAVIPRSSAAIRRPSPDRQERVPRFLVILGILPLICCQPIFPTPYLTNRKLGRECPTANLLILFNSCASRRAIDL